MKIRIVLKNAGQLSPWNFTAYISCEIQAKFFEPRKEFSFSRLREEVFSTHLFETTSEYLPIIINFKILNIIENRDVL